MDAPGNPPRKHNNALKAVKQYSIGTIGDLCDSLYHTLLAIAIQPIQKLAIFSNTRSSPERVNRACHGNTRAGELIELIIGL
jgi:hypothetical protein